MQGNNAVLSTEEGALKKKPKRVLISNDDGVQATGLRVLIDSVAPFYDEIWTVAPERECSGAGHSLTLHRPLRLRCVSERLYAVDGTPTDCVLLAIKHILKDKPPDLVLSGFNAGANLGEDITYSGTVAAAMEATLLGIPAIALSQIFMNDRDEISDQVDWQVAKTYVCEIITKLMAHDWQQDVFFNVNFPCCDVQDVKGIQLTHQGRHLGGGLLEEKVDPRGRHYFWIGGVGTHIKPNRGSDLAAIDEGCISITPLHINLTHQESMNTLSLS